jgi:hypothetical protein
MKIVKAVFLVFIMIAVPAAPEAGLSGNSPGNLERHIRSVYLEPDDVFVARAVNRFHSLGRAQIQHWIPRCPDDSACVAMRLRDGLFIVRRQLETGAVTAHPLDQERNPDARHYRGLLGLHLASDPSVWAADLILDSFVRTPRGEFLFFRYERLEKDSASLVAADLKLPRTFFQGFVHIDDGRLTGPKIETIAARPPTDEYERELWDVFLFEGRENILIRKLVYDAELFEVFVEENDGRMIRVLEFIFSGD